LTPLKWLLNRGSPDGSLGLHSRHAFTGTGSSCFAGPPPNGHEPASALCSRADVEIGASPTRSVRMLEPSTSLAEAALGSVWAVPRVELTQHAGEPCLSSRIPGRALDHWSERQWRWESPAASRSSLPQSGELHVGASFHWPFRPVDRGGSPRDPRGQARFAPRVA